MSGLLTTLTVLCLALVLPLGIRLLSAPLTVPAGWWLSAGASAGLGTVLPTGPAAVLLVVPLAGLCVAIAAMGTVRLRELGSGPAPAARAAAALSATSSLAVVALALLVDRAGAAPFLGFGPTVWRLTVLHFCVAGFAASLLVGLAAVAAPCAATHLGCWAVPTGTALVGAGHFLGPWLEPAGAVALTSGLLASSWVVLRRVVRWSDSGGQLLAVAAGVTPATMALALWWALGEAVDLPHPTLTWTAATHGVGNALGIGLAGVLGWTTITQEQL